MSSAPVTHEPDGPDGGGPEVRDIAVVIAGAGARGAYEAGLLRHLVPEIAARTRAEGRTARFTLIGTSAGSINSALIGSRAPEIAPGASPDQVRRAWTQALAPITDVWRGIAEGDVLSLWPGGRVRAALSRVVPVWHKPWLSLLNTAPLIRLASDPAVVDFPALHANVRAGALGAVGAAATSAAGRTAVFLDRPVGPYLPADEARRIDYVDVPGGLLPEHILASSSIPAAFPPTPVRNPPQAAGWYTDGGVRLNTPLKPALALGADHVLVVATSPLEYPPAQPGGLEQAPAEIDEALIPVADQLLADQIVQDLFTLRSRNADGSAAVVRYLFAGPPSPRTLADLAAQNVTERTLVRLLGRTLTQRARGELTSYLLFDAGYLDAAARAGAERAAELLPPGNDAVPWLT